MSSAQADAVQAYITNTLNDGDATYEAFATNCAEFFDAALSAGGISDEGAGFVSLPAGAWQGVLRAEPNAQFSYGTVGQ